MSQCDQWIENLELKIANFELNRKIENRKLKIEEPLAKLSGFEVINRFVRAVRPSAMEVAVFMFAQSP